jgi:hypothetical protein
MIEAVRAGLVVRSARGRATASAPGGSPKDTRGFGGGLRALRAPGSRVQSTTFRLSAAAAAAAATRPATIASASCNAETGDPPAAHRPMFNYP